MTQSRAEIVEECAKALIEEYKLIWPGSWPALPEATRLARTVLSQVRPCEAVPHTDKTKEGWWGCLRCDESWPSRPASCAARRSLSEARPKEDK